MRIWLIIWWVSCTAVTWWRWADLAPLVVGVSTVAAAVFVALVLGCSPRRRAVRLAVYVSALVANQAASAASGLWPLLPAHQSEAVRATWTAVGKSIAIATVAVATFVLVQAWLTEGRDHRRVSRRQQLPRRQAAIVGATAALAFLAFTAIVTDLLELSWAGLGLGPIGYPHEHGQPVSAWPLALAKGSLDGAIEEPVYVGVLTLLWPRLRARTFIPLALLSGLARSVMHLYYAATAVHLAAAVILVGAWCLCWSSWSLYLIYRARMLWPVIVGHGVNNLLRTPAGPFDMGATPPWVYAVALVPMTGLLTLVAVALLPYLPKSKRAPEATAGSMIHRLDRTGPKAISGQRSTTVADVDEGMAR